MNLKEHEYLIRSQVRKVTAFCKGALCEEDLMQAARIGITRAAEKFEPERGIQFKTYAMYWIRQSIWKELCRLGYPVRYPTYKLAEIRKAKGKVPFGLSLDAPLGSTGSANDMSHKDLLEQDTDEPELQDQDIEVLRAKEEEILLGILTEREADILRACAAGEPLVSAGKRHGISRERARQLYERSLERVRQSPRLGELREFLESA